jgi:cell division protein FtsL
MRGWTRAKRLVGRVIGERRRRAFVLAGIFLVVATVAAIFVSRQVSIAELRHQVARLEAQQVDATTQQKALRAEVASTTDPKTLEEEARQRLGLVKPGEEKVFFVEEDSP